MTNMTTPTLAQIEAQYLKARDRHEASFPERLIELDRKGDWLHRNWFTAGYLSAHQAQQDEIKQLREALDSCTAVALFELSESSLDRLNYVKHIRKQFNLDGGE